MNIKRPRAGMVPLALAAVVCAVPLGCRGGSAPPTPAADARLSPDEQVLQALDCYNPQYKVDEDGHVTDLNLVWRGLSPSAMTEIDKLTDLEHIDLAYSTMNDDGLVQLKDLQKLRTMGLTGTPVTDGGLVHLEKMQNLQWVWLPKEGVSEAAVEKLKEARPDMHIYLQ